MRDPVTVLIDIIKHSSKMNIFVDITPSNAARPTVFCFYQTLKLLVQCKLWEKSMKATVASKIIKHLLAELSGMD